MAGNKLDLPVAPGDITSNWASQALGVDTSKSWKIGQLQHDDKAHASAIWKIGLEGWEGIAVKVIA